MPNHRNNRGSLSVHDLIGDITATRSARHRAGTGVGDRIKVVAGAAVAAGAFLGVAGQVTPAVATAAPLVPADRPAENVSAPHTAPEVANDPALSIAAPFGLTGLPAEIAGPLAQAEQTIKDLQRQFAPAAAAPEAQTSAPAVLPVGGEISSEFGSRWGTFHYGVDIADAIGTPIRSALGGTVLEAGPADGFGLWVRVLQDDGTTAVYGHINEYFVQAGQRVNAGDVIASVGNRGYSTGPHLHLEIWDQGGNKIDPVSWLARNGVLMEQHWGAD